MLDWLIGMTHMLHHSCPSILARDDLEFIVGDFTRRRECGDTTVFCYPQVIDDGDQAVVSVSAEPCTTRHGSRRRTRELVVGCG
ncbi:MAG: hypothetical protein QOG94_639 [Solirubrobacteraceae bacterium]|jgi:hypothetical protein|nr:hypothetical protein [Solirubrobacteraceae bacterium]